MSRGVDAPSAVTVHCGEGPHNVHDMEKRRRPAADPRQDRVGDDVARHEQRADQPGRVLHRSSGPSTRTAWRSRGLSRDDVSLYLFDRARMPAAVFRRHFEELAWAQWMKTGARRPPAADDRRPGQHPGPGRRRPRQAHAAGALVGHDPQRHPARRRMTKEERPMTVTIYLPDSEPGPETVHLAPSPASLAGLRIAVLDNGKPNAALVMTRAAETLAERTGATRLAGHQEGPAGTLGQRRHPVRARHLRARARGGRHRDHRHGRLRELHRLQRLRHHRAREGRAAVRGRHHDAVRADRVDDGAPTSGCPTSARSCSTTRSAAPTATTLHQWADAAADRLVALFTGAE